MNNINRQYEAWADLQLARYYAEQDEQEDRIAREDDEIVGQQSTWDLSGVPELPF